MRLSVANCRDAMHCLGDMNESKITVAHGYVGFLISVNGVDISALVDHGEIATDSFESEYTVGAEVRCLWHLSESPFEFQTTRVSLRDFRTICRRHGITFSWK